MLRRLLEGAGVTLQDVNILEGRIRAHGLQESYYAALMLTTFRGLGSLGRLRQNMENATLRQRYAAALRVLGQ